MLWKLDDHRDHRDLSLATVWLLGGYCVYDVLDLGFVYLCLLFLLAGVYLALCLSVGLSVGLFIFLSIYLSIHRFLMLYSHSIPSPHPILSLSVIPSPHLTPSQPPNRPTPHPPNEPSKHQNHR
ncbi:hypothetical protein BZA77DRAFT_103537 [Pyronema omphalodes]|nr:hypothetical protein BZA77DRAFT_103537 [Pyronema omphalodes]